MTMVSDFHTHILPRIDDGSASVEESLALLHVEAAQGVKRVVATPHFYPHREGVAQFLDKRSAAAERLSAAMRDEPLPKVLLGAEVYYFRGISECDMLDQLAIEGTDCILIEMPLGCWTDTMYQELEHIAHCRGLTPIIAHVDRYISPLRTYGIPQRLAELPVLVQANASAFLNRRTARLVMRLLQKGQIHLLGSDCHNLKERPPNLQAALRAVSRKLGEGTLEEILRTESQCFRKDESKFTPY